MPKHRHQEFLKFMNKVVRTTAKDLDIPIILDDYATHKHPKVKQWLLAVTSVDELIQAITDYIASRNENPHHLDSHRPPDPQEGEQSQ